MSFKKFNCFKIYKQSVKTAKIFNRNFFCIFIENFILTFMLINFINITLVSSKTIKDSFLKEKLINGLIDNKKIFINNTSVPQNLNKTVMKYSNKKNNVRNVKNLNNNFNEFKQIFNLTNELIENSTKVNNSLETKFLEDSNENSSLDTNHYSLLMKIVICLILIVLILLTIVGNIFVIVAICLDKNLQSAQNYLVLSLAVADLTVAILVMPLCAHMEILQKWTLGSELCTFWNLIDVFSCTASILHLLGIALDRYWSVSSLHYSQRRSLQRMMYLIAAIWLAAAVISMPPLLGVKDPEYANRVKNGQCLMSQDVGYQVFATFSTFYLPCAVILLLYWKIYKVARKRIRNKPGNQSNSNKNKKNKKNKDIQVSTISRDENRISINSNLDDENQSVKNKKIISNKNYQVYDSNLKKNTKIINEEIKLNILKNNEEKINCLKDESKVNNELNENNDTNNNSKFNLKINNESNQILENNCLLNKDCVKQLNLKNLNEKQDSLNESNKNNKIINKNLVNDMNLNKKMLRNSEKRASSSLINSIATTATILKNKHHNNTFAKKERKTAKILAIITGIFMICWFPFFMNALMRAIFPKKVFVSDLLSSIFLWLGYANSSLNPIIYTIFSPDFRNAFKKILIRCKN